MAVSVLLVLAGAGLLSFSGSRLVDYAAAVAGRLRLTPAVIGLTVVAAGTSAPELTVSLLAALRGSPAIALGNVVGSNSANIGLILGVAALIAAIPLSQKVIKFEYPFMLLASWIVLLLCRDGVLDRLESAFFVASAGAFLAYSVWLARQETTRTDMEALARQMTEHGRALAARSGGVLAAGLAAALVGLAAGAHLLVAGAVDLALALGLSERVVGLTLVAVGTSLPELVASVAAALKRQHEMAVTNIVGSNIFNLLVILGTTGLVRAIPVDPGIARVDVWVMLGFSVLPLPMVAWDLKLSRSEGGLLLALYGAYLGALVAFG